MSRNSEENRESQPPLVGIALAAYQPNPVWFWSQLTSIQKQTYRNFRCFVTFDSPMAAVLDRPEALAFKNDGRFTFIENPGRLGYKKNFECALGHCLKASAEFLAFCDQDDIWYAHKLQQAMNTIKAQAATLVFCNYDKFFSGSVTDEGSTTKDGWKRDAIEVSERQQCDLLVRNVANGCAMVFSADLLRRDPQFPEAIAHHDWWVILLFNRWGTTVPIQQPGFSYRIHQANVIGATEYKGFFTLQAGVKRSLREDLCAAYLDSEKAYQSLHSRQMALPKARMLFAPCDFGLLLFLAGLIKLARAPRTAKTYFARALGKALVQSRRLVGGKGNT